MQDNTLFTVSEFAKLSRTTRNTLHHYDAIDLLSPVQRGDDNGYRYYSSGQLAVINVIRTFQALGMSLAEIKELGDRRTPELVDEVFAQQTERIDKKIEEWVRAQKLLYTLRKTILSVKNIDEDIIRVEYFPPEAIVLGDLNDYGRCKNDFHAFFQFYHSIGERFPNLDLNFPVCSFFLGERIRNRDWVWPDRYYFSNPAGRDKRPAGRYAVGYTRCAYGQGGELYSRMIDYIDNNNFEICGDAYEEYPLNEVCILDDSNYLMRVMIAVRER